MDTVISIIENAMGPFLFVAAFMSFVSLKSTQIDYLQASKEVYLSDSVYSQQNSDYEAIETISREEIVATLVATPSMDIEINVVGLLGETPNTYKLYIDVLGTNSVKITKSYMYNSETVEEPLGTYFNMQGFDWGIIPAGNYTQEYSYRDGEMYKVTYSIKY